MIKLKTLRTVFFTILLSGFSSFIFSQTIIIKKLTVYIFLSEICPICQSYTLPLKELYKKYSPKEIRFIGVFPNYYAHVDSIASFKNKYNIPFELFIDQNAKLTTRLGATITPEVFIESFENKILYSGRIDDSFVALGKRRKVITSNDLDDALNCILTNKEIKLKKTQAIGCIIRVSK